jgi:coproporphyrinogen III oxidase-like Fe-S oxidoreductase
MKKIKTYVLIVSRTFPATHKRKGEQTYFPEKIDQLYFSKDTRLFSEKLHTIRSNYELWEKRITEIQKGNAILSIRYWSGKPYNSKQVEICQLDKYSGIGVQKIVIDQIYRYTIDENKQEFNFEELAKNDGLSKDDFAEWFKYFDKIEPMAIIHFTNFRY